jgi:hypothetical protein
MRLSHAQVVALRLGAVACLVGCVVLVVVALTVDTGDATADEVSVVDDPAAFALPDPGVFGGQVVVYGEADGPGVAPRDLGCRLLSRSGTEQSAARMSQLRVLGTDPVEVDGQRLEPLFTVGSYPRGSTIECTQAGPGPYAVSIPSTFGTAGPLVRGVAIAGAVAMLAVGLGGLVVLRRPARR